MIKTKYALINALEKVTPYWTLWLRAHANLYSGEKELKYLKRLVPSGNIAIDVGANKGVYSYWMAKYARRTIAFEAVSYTHLTLPTIYSV